MLNTRTKAVLIGLLVAWPVVTIGSNWYAARHDKATALRRAEAVARAVDAAKIKERE